MKIGRANEIRQAFMSFLGDNVNIADSPSLRITRRAVSWIFAGVGPRVLVFIV